MARRLGGPQSRSGRGGEEKNSQSLPRLELSIIQPVVQRYTTELVHTYLFTLYVNLLDLYLLLTFREVTLLIVVKKTFLHNLFCILICV
jgi:hypothetical protein